jgi:hypothetical protein
VAVEVVEDGAVEGGDSEIQQANNERFYVWVVGGLSAQDDAVKHVQVAVHEFVVAVVEVFLPQGKHVQGVGEDMLIVNVLNVTDDAL